MTSCGWMLCRVLSFLVVILAAFYAFKRDNAAHSISHSRSLNFKIFAIGDCHGDLKSALRILKMAKIVDRQRNWIANNSILVQTGDIVDRGPDTIELYKLFQTLAVQAERAGGRVVSLLGNHEVMNMMGDLRYVDEKDIKSFGDRSKRSREWSKSGTLGKYLRSLNITSKIHKSVFVHGGIHPAFANIEEINSKSREALNIDPIPYDKLLVDPDCPIWFRGYATDRESTACELLRKALLKMDAERMIVGHTPQESGLILARCNISLTANGKFEPRVYVIDLGISAAYGAVAQGLLEIEGYLNGDVTVSGVYFGGRKKLN